MSFEELDRALKESHDQAIKKSNVERIERDFTYHAPKPEQQPKYQQIRDKAKELALLIVDITPQSREQSLALTNLEQAVMWGNAAIARNE